MHYELAFLLLFAMILSGCETTTSGREVDIPTVKVPVMSYRMSSRPNVPWSPQHDYKAVLVNGW